MSEKNEIENVKKSHKKLIIILIIVAVLALVFVIFGIPYIKRHFIEKEVDLLLQSFA